MPELYMITVPGLNVASDWAVVHDRLLDDFAQVTDVLATTMAGTLLIVYRGRADIDAWLDRIDNAIVSARIAAGKERSFRDVLSTTVHSSSPHRATSERRAEQSGLSINHQNM